MAAPPWPSRVASRSSPSRSERPSSNLRGKAMRSVGDGAFRRLPLDTFPRRINFSAARCCVREQSSDDVKEAGYVAANFPVSSPLRRCAPSEPRAGGKTRHSRIVGIRPVSGAGSTGDAQTAGREASRLDRRDLHGDARTRSGSKSDAATAIIRARPQRAAPARPAILDGDVAKVWWKLRAVQWQARRFGPLPGSSGCRRCPR